MTDAVALEGLEGGRGELRNRDGEFLNGSERFAEFFAKAGGGLIESIQDIGAAGSARLAGDDALAGGAIDGLQIDEEVFVIEGRDAARKHRFAADALAKIASGVSRELVLGRAAHHAESGSHFAVGNNVEAGRLIEVEGEGLPESVIEERIAGFVVEVGDDDGVFFGDGRVGSEGVDAENQSGKSDGNNGSRGEEEDFFATPVRSGCNDGLDFVGRNMGMFRERRSSWGVDRNIAGGVAEADFTSETVAAARARLLDVLLWAGELYLFLREPRLTLAQSIASADSGIEMRAGPQRVWASLGAAD